MTHQVFEEIRGVIAANAAGVLSREAYRTLGVRQSIFPESQRDKLYDVFEKYRAWLLESKLYDLNLVAQEWQPLAAPQYDFVVIDEVQDITGVQLVNALYVALTRAVKNLYVIESDLGHPLFELLDMRTGQVTVDAQKSTLEDWQKEARKLELQGKQEQADAIRRGILKETPVPWPVFDADKVNELLIKVFREQAPGSKFKPAYTTEFK